MVKYKVILSTRARAPLLDHISFLTRVSLSAARKIRNSFDNIRRRLSDIIVEGNVVFVDSVVDCRQQRDSVSVNR